MSNNLDWMEGVSAMFHASTKWQMEVTLFSNRWCKNLHNSLQSLLKWERKNRLWQLKAIKWNMISPCLRKNPLWYLECTVLYKRYRSLALNIGLFKKKIGKMSFGTNIHSLQSSVFATRKKKVLQRQEIGLLFVLVKA